MTTTKNILLALIAIALFACAYLLLNANQHAKASDATTLLATIATTSNPTVGTTAVTLFATTTACTDRVVTTYASPVMLTFSDVLGQTPTGTFGHLQAASTTVAYDAGLYGCGRVKVYSFTAQAITVSESR